MRIALLSTIRRRTPPPPDHASREKAVSILAEGLVARGADVTLFATANSITKGKQVAVCPCGFEDDRRMDFRLWESLHVSQLFEHGDEFDLIHNHAGYLPLTYSRMTTTPIVTTLYEIPSPEVVNVYKKYAARSAYAAVSRAGRAPGLSYAATIPPGLETGSRTFVKDPGESLLYFGPIHPDFGVKDAVTIARAAKRPLTIVGQVHDERYFGEQILPEVDGTTISYVGSVDEGRLDGILGGALALLFPVRTDVPFCLNVLEAMACGTPVIAGARGCLPDLVDNGKTGFLVGDLEEAVEAVAKAGGLDRAACRARVEERFSAAGAVEAYLDLYARVVSRQKREDHRPWGFYTILSDAEDCKVKRITVRAGQRLSLQRHQRRAEHWHVVHGRGLVTLDGSEIEVGEGRSLDIPRGSFHRIRNPGQGDLVFIEVQTGEYFGEDDIERVEDDYGRA